MVKLAVVVSKGGWGMTNVGATWGLCSPINVWEGDVHIVDGDGAEQVRGERAEGM